MFTKLAVFTTHKHLPVTFLKKAVLDSFHYASRLSTSQKQILDRIITKHKPVSNTHSSFQSECIKKVVFHRWYFTIRRLCDNLGQYKKTRHKPVSFQSECVVKVNESRDHSGSV